MSLDGMRTLEDALRWALTRIANSTIGQGDYFERALSILAAAEARGTECASTEPERLGPQGERPGPEGARPEVSAAFIDEAMDLAWRWRVSRVGAEFNDAREALLTHLKSLQGARPTEQGGDRGPVMSPSADLMHAIEAERYACSIVVWMTLQEALEPDADDKGLDGWMREAERRIKSRGLPSLVARGIVSGEAGETLAARPEGQEPGPEGARPTEQARTEALSVQPSDWYCCFVHHYMGRVRCPTCSEGTTHEQGGDHGR